MKKINIIYKIIIMIFVSIVILTQNIVYASMADYDDETADKICRKEIIDEILSLPDTMKEILFLYGYLGYNIKEIAGLLNITEQAAYKRLQRARTILAQKIERGCNQ